MEIQATTDQQQQQQTITGPTLGKEDFLKLLVQQLQNQDPLNPVSNDDFIAQMTQFSMLEQMQNLNQSVTNLARDSGIGTAALLAGHRVEFTADGELQSAVVDQVIFREGAISLKAGDTEFPLSDLVSVLAAETENNE